MAKQLKDNFIENRIFKELKVGDKANLNRTLTLKDIELFAIMSGDVNPANQFDFKERFEYAKL